MANTLTGLIPTLYNALDLVSRELIGFIPNVTMDAQASMAAVGQSVTSPIVPQGSLEDITPGATPADSGDTVLGYQSVSITKSKAYPVRWTGEEQLSVTPNGVINTVLRDQFTQGFRTIANAVEADLAALYTKASRAYGTAGTTPFATAADMTDLSNANRILDDNGAPLTDRSMIIGSAARANLEGKQSQLFKVNEAGTDGLLRTRASRELMGFQMGYSSQVASVTKGTGASYTTNTAGYAVGATSITLITGTGTVLAGDVVTFAGDTNKYVVATGVAAPGTIVLAAPGLRQAIAASAVAMTIGNNFTGNLFFHKSALLLAARQPAMPVGGDDADDVTTVTDPLSGMTFQVALYKQYRRIKYEIGLAWGTAAPNPRYLGVMLG